jgi:exodeoxyribonuclease V alpha subunit
MGSIFHAETHRVEKHETMIADGALIVIDEASMIDLPTFYRLLRCLPETIRMILVGDPAQLPPIGFGLVLHALKEQPYIPQVELTKVYRQADETGIPTVAGAIRVGNLPSLPAVIGEDRCGVVLISRSDPLQTEDIVDIVAELGGFGEDLRILSAVKAGPVGIDALNARFHTIMAAGKPTWHGFAVGDPVMFLRNDYRRDLRNGSLGEVKAIEDELLLAVFDGNEHLFQRKDLGDLMLAYAITIHKAQGSQFRRVVMPIAPSKLLDRSLIYTGVTRAIDLAVMIGSPSVLGPAIAQEQFASRREVGIDALLSSYS